MNVLIKASTQQRLSARFSHVTKHASFCEIRLQQAVGGKLVEKYSENIEYLMKGQKQWLPLAKESL